MVERGRSGAAVPLPLLKTGSGRFFVGRKSEVDWLYGLWQETAVGDRRVALIGGEPGVGKTRFAAELARAAHAEGSTVLAGRCDEDLGAPYQPFVEALRYFAAHLEEGDVASRLGRHGGELVRLVPELVDSGLPPALRSDPETERYRLFDAVASWLALTSVDRPVVLILDDLQWATKPTLLMLRHVACYPEPLRLLMVGTYRDTELDANPALTEVLADLRYQGGVERLTLVGLDEEGVVEYLEAAAGYKLDEEDRRLARAIHAQTEGNPFFVGEVLRHLAETGVLSQRKGRWVATAAIEELGIPEGIREVVGRRLSRLSETTNRVLTLAAVIGPEFEFTVLQLVTRLDDDALVAALHEAMAARLVVELSGDPPRYRFSHALVRATLYEGPGPARVALHRRVGEAIEAIHGGRLDAHLPALAHHFARGSTIGDISKAVAYCARVGDRAQAQFAYAEAVTYYRQALGLLAEDLDDSTRRELMISLGEAERRAGDPAHRDTLLAAARLARQQQDADALARAALANSRQHFFSVIGEVDGERVEVLEAALEMVGMADSSTRAQLLAILGIELVYRGDGGRCRSLSDEALAVARRLGDPDTLAHVLLSRYFTIWTPETLTERRANTAELLAVTHRLVDPAVTSRAWVLRYRSAIEACDIEEADRCLDPGARLATEVGQPAIRWFETCDRAGRFHLAGRLKEAERLGHEALEFGQAGGQPEAAAAFALLLFQIRRDQGRLEELEAQLVEMSAQHPGVPLFDATLALRHCEVGRKAHGREIFERLASRGFARSPRNHIWLMGTCYCASVCAHLGDEDRAEELHSLLAGYPEQVITVSGTTAGSLSLYVGLLARTLGNLEEAAARFEAAATVDARMGASASLGRSQQEWARTLMARRRPGDIERARALQELSARLAQPNSQLPGGLTEREAHVLRLVASGKSNKAIASDLSLSVKTIERHLANIFTKLGVNSRAAATSFAHRRGLI